jgi:KDO2-lipid IV(A) lauroyltransferase
MIRLALAVLWLLHFLPLPVLAVIGEGAGWLAFWLIPERRRVTRINLEKCFPDLPAAARERIARAHFRRFVRCLIEYSLPWWASRERVLRLVRVEGIEQLRAHPGEQAILFVPHFVAMEIGAARLSCELRMVAMYTQQKHRGYGATLLRGRSRFGDQKLVSRQEGARRLVAAMREGRILHFSPDQDYGPRDAMFVPFFGVRAATVPSLSRIARLSRAKVFPCVTKVLPGGRGYVVTIEPPWDDYPGADVEADTRRMNAYLERKIQEMPEQYLWMHKRFKTRPEGEARFYR